MKNFDLSMKANDLRERRLARSQLIGAPLFIAQLGAYEIRQDLISGKEDILDKIQPHTVGTAAEFKKALGQAPPLEIIKFVNKPLFEKLSKGLLQHADDLDYVQDVVTSLGEKTGLNPSMNAVADAFMRKRFTGRFKREGQSVELDTLLHSSSKTAQDADEEAGKQQTNFRSSNPCHHFQNGSCPYARCRFLHICSLCKSNSHGSKSCILNQDRSSYTSPRAYHIRERISYKPSRVKAAPKDDRPPHPRYRRTRARD